ncbi:MAG TPA: hypothetical protein PLV68_10195 [Ilumatobacteraceae bacterium]|nr:hypothetical protein [Ilumatobacteraceae bacterium]
MNGTILERPDPDDLEARLRSHFDAVAADTQVTVPARFQTEPMLRLLGAQPPVESRRPVRWIAAAAAVAVAGGGLTVALWSGGSSTDTGGSAATDAALIGPAGTLGPVLVTDPVLWMPDGSRSEIRITQLYEALTAPVATGAVIAPDGTVYSLLVTSIPSTDPIVSGASETHVVGGRTVTVRTETGLAGYTTRQFEQGCVTVSVSNGGGADGWGPDVEAVLGAITLEGAATSLSLPIGWASLGAAETGHQYAVEFDVRLGGATRSVSMWQMPDASVGFYLGMLAGSPVQLDPAAWAVDADPGEGLSGPVVVERDGTAFYLAGAATATELRQIADSFVRAPLSAWTTARRDDVTAITTAGAAPGCAAPTLTIR